MKRIAVIPGDGIGIDVTRESMCVLRRVNEVFGAGLEFVEFDWGAEKYLREGVALPAGAFGVSVLHDEDQDGRLGTNWAGIPAEGYGASRGARRRFGAPRWNDARLSLAGGEEQRVVVEVGY